MKRAVLLLALGLVAGVIVAGVTVGTMVRTGLSAHDEPTRMEAFLARRARHWAVPAELRNAKNPLPLTATVLEEGRAHFADHCATCHGNDGKGDALGKQMYPKAPDMTLAATQSMSDGELFAIIENGVRLTGMPGFGSGTADSAYGSWSLVHFIRHLPKLTEAEIAAMRKLNPKSPAEWEALSSGNAGASAAQPHHH